MLKQYHLKDYNFILVVLVLALSVLGIFAVGSADSDIQSKQIMGVILGLTVMVTVSLFDYVWVLRFYWIFYIAGIVLLAAVILVGVSSNNAQRWLVIGPLQFQPSDLMKIILILFYAQFFSARQDKLNSFKTIGLAVAAIAIPWVLIFRQPNLSTSILVLLLFCAIYFAAGLGYRIIIGIAAIFVPLAIMFFNAILKPGQTLLKDYQVIRILAWLHPEQYPEQAMQQQNSILAIGSGQLYGKGLANTAVNSVKNANYLSEAQTDFIFAVCGEELGFLGCFAIICLEIAIAICCIYMGSKAREYSGKLICSGVGALIGIQSIMNISVASGFMPNTGLPLPFVSAGLSSLVSMYIGIGLVLNVGLQVKKH